jgi:sugar lactone lactonase YvrE
MKQYAVVSWVSGALVLAASHVGCGSEARIPEQTPQDGEAAPGRDCDNDLLANGGCSVGRCKVTSASQPLPLGTVLRLAETPVPAELAGDAVPPSMCTVRMPPGTNATGLVLAIESTESDEVPEHARLFQHRAPGDDVLLPASGRFGNETAGILERGGTYGVTAKPGGWSFDRYVASEVVGSSSTPLWLRNVSSQTTYAAFFDGKNLYVGNGPRILVYEGIPASPEARPKLVLGQPDLDTTVAATSGALFGGAAVVGLWSDGNRLVATTGNRILVWQQIPTKSLIPADLVLGQPDMTSNRANAGAVASATTLSSPSAISSDGTRLYVADGLNHRVLGWSAFPVASSTPADLVIGQPDFVSAAAYSGNLPMYIPQGITASSSGVFVSGIGKPALAFVSGVPEVNPSATHSVFGWQYGLEPGGQVARPAGIALLSGGGVAVRDFGLMRIACKRSADAGPSEIDYALGQPDATRVVSVRFGDNGYVNPARVNASALSLAIGLSSSADGKVFVPDSRRLLVYDTPPTYNYEPASRVIGQPGFTVNERADYRGVSLSTLASPADVAARNGLVAVADKSNNRVLLFRANALGSRRPAAFAAIGQPSGSSFVANKDIVSASAATLSGPEGVALDGQRLVVADTQNHRVLIWNTVPTATGAPADVVLGQADFSGRRPNRGRGDVSPRDGFSDADADGFFYPTGVATDGTHLFVADRLNHRVLVWDSIPTTNGKAADRVLGQPTMQATGAHRGQGPFDIAADGFNLPSGLALDGTTLWVADTENNRVVRWDSATTAAAAPVAWLGQPDGVTVSNPNYQLSGYYAGSDVATPAATTATSVLRPRGITIAGGKVFVSEGDSNRVHAFDAGSLSPLAVLGQANETSASPNTTGIGRATLADPAGLTTDGTHLWVADARNHRVVGYALDAVATGASGQRVLGQSSMLTGGFNQSSVAAAGATLQPRGLTLDGDSVFVADTGNSRILEHDVSGGAWLVKRVFGQPNASLALPNSGEQPSARTLNAPRGVWADAKRLVVADTGNHRVLVFDRSKPASDAVTVLGQPSFSSAISNAGGPGAATMQLPAGVCSDATRLAVTDSANHRVLLWKSLPEASGASADVVLGQATASAVLANRGSSLATARTMVFPSGCTFHEGKLLVADTGNNRVLRFDPGAATTGAAAEAVLGQPDASARTPAASVLERDRLAGPSALATDGTYLYVSDRDLGRVVVMAADGQVVEVIGGLGSASLLRAGDGVAVKKTGLFTSRLFVSETGTDRVGVVEGVSRLRLP